MHICAIRRNGYQRPYEDPDEARTLDGQRETIYLAEYDGEGLEPCVEQAIDEAHVKIEDEDDRLLEIEREVCINFR